MLKNDRWIKERCYFDQMIVPYIPKMVRAIPNPEFPEFCGNPVRKVLSFGRGSYGYDLRLSATEFLIFRHVPGTVMNPKRFKPANLEPAELHNDEDGDFFILPAHTYGLGVALEHVNMPPTSPACASARAPTPASASSPT